jgi:oligopeptide transport system substrate-binding protein
MTHTASSRRFTLPSLVTILTLILSGCGSPATPTVVHYPTSTRPYTTPTPNLTPTATAAPTYTPAPSPTPPGYINLFYAGFSLTVPVTWKVDQPAANTIMLSSLNDPLLIGVMSIAEKEATPLAQIISQVRSQFDPDNTTLTHLVDGEMDLPDGIKAQTQDFRLSNPKGKTELRIAYAHSGGFSYVISINTNLGGLVGRKLLIDSVVNSLHFFTPQASGLPHDQTLVMLGGEPDPSDLDPAVTTSSAADYVGLLYAGLVRLTPDLKVAPSLAEKWNISPDGLVYTFSLPQGLKFASGKALTAQDVKDSWERACDPKTGSTTARTYLGDIVGVMDKLDGKATSVSGIKVVDNLTLEVTLDGPKPYFLAKLTYPTALVMDVSTTQKGGDWVFSPDASGPYKLREHEKDMEMVFERNPNYPQLAAIPYVVFMAFGGGSALSLYEQGSIDILPLGAAQIQQVSKPSDPSHAQLVTTVSMCTSLLQFKPGIPPTDDANVRKALSLAIDKKALQAKLEAQSSLIAAGILPPAMPGFLQTRKTPPFSAKAAQDALAASKYGANLPPITLVVGGDATSASQSPYLLGLVDMWQKNLGIKVQMEYVDPVALTKAERESKGNILGYSWCADYPDPQNFLDVLYHSQSEFNVGGVQDPALDQLLEQARTEQDGAKRVALYQQAESLILDQNYSLPVFFPLIGEVVQPRVKGFVLSPIHAASVPWLSLGDGASK